MSEEVLSHKFVAILNKKVPQGRLLNALGHMSLGLGGLFPDMAVLRLDTYLDKDNGEHKSISDYPFIVLAADNANQVRTVRQKLLEAGISFTDFIDTMTVGTFAEQKERTRQKTDLELEYFGVCAFGPKEVLDPITKKFSLWK
jgi:hypothetical protein